MRVISGKYKGRTLKGDKIKGTRPTMDKIKESLFAMIQSKVENSICLDLFAGSGSLGIEAISNGASFCYFIDMSKEAYEIIKENIKMLKIEDQAKVILMDFEKALSYFKDNDIKFDLIFLDPPYQNNIINKVLNYINDNNLLLPNGQVICEYMNEELMDEYGNLRIIKNKKYGDKYIKIYNNNV